MEECNYASMSYLISAIIPIYQSEPFLEHCCRSLFEQTLTEIEYLFIIDGYSEVAEVIINRLLLDYPRRRGGVRVIRHEQNMGISHCRQEGNDLAKGKYLFHCDSDDWMEPEALQLLIEKAETSQADMVFFDYARHYDNNRMVVCKSNGVLQGQIPTMDAPLHNKLILAELVRNHHLHFPLDINWGEDLCLSLLCQMVARRIAYLPKCLYHQLMHTQSFTAQINKDKYMQLVACPRFIESELQRLGREMSELDLMRMKFEVKEYFLIHPQIRDLKQWIHFYPECHPHIWQFTDVPLYLKCVASLVVYHMDWMADWLLQCRDKYNSFRL